MTRSLLAFVSALFLGAAALAASPAPAIKNLPQLGAPAPDTLFTTEKHEKECRTSADHQDPCTEVEIGGIRYTIAWDAQSKAVTYIFTDDHHILTDGGLSVGDTCRIAQDSGPSDPTVPYMKWFIDPKWKGTDPSAGTAAWYVALRKDSLDHHFGDIVGFVQSRYIALKP